MGEIPHRAQVRRIPFRLPTPRRRLAIAVATLVVAPVCICTGLLGTTFAVMELTSHHDLGRFALGLFWFAVALNAWVAVWAVIWKPRWWLGPSLAAAISGLLVFLEVIWVDGLSPTRESWVLLPSLLALLAVLAVVAMFRAAHLSPVKSWKVIVATVVPLAGVLQFWYTTQYLPVVERPHLNLSTSLDRGNPPRPSEQGLIPLQGTVTIENKSRAQVAVLGSFYRVSVEAKPVGAPQSSLSAVEAIELARSFEWRNNSRPYRSSLGYPPSGLIQADELVPLTSFFEPGERWSTTFVVLVPEERYNVATLQVQVDVARKVRLSLEKPEPCFDQTVTERLPDPENKFGPRIANDGSLYVCVQQEVDARTAVEKVVGDRPLLVRRQLSLTDSGAMSCDPPTDCKPAPDVDVSGQSGSFPKLDLWVANKESFDEILVTAKQDGEQGQIDERLIDERQIKVNERFADITKSQADKYSIVTTDSSYELPISR